jgi:hypothetical protein
LGHAASTSSFRGPPAIPMNPGTSSMLSHTIKCIALTACCLWADAALALEPCHHGVPAIDIEQGSFEKVPGYIDPDEQTLRPDGKLQEQRWRNLHGAVRPLRAGSPTTPGSMPICEQSPTGSLARQCRYLHLEQRGAAATLLLTWPNEHCTHGWYAVCVVPRASSARSCCRSKDARPASEG